MRIHLIYLLLALLSFPARASRNATPEISASVPLTTFRTLTGNEEDNRARSVRQTATGYVVGGSEEDANGEIYGTISHFDIDGNLEWSRRLDFPSVINDVYFTGSNILFVGSTVTPDQFDREGVLGTADMTGVVTANRYDLGPRTYFVDIVENDQPANPAFPYYISGQTSTTAFQDYPLLINIDENLNVNFQRSYPAGQDFQAPSLRLAEGGNMIFFGNIGEFQGQILKIDNTGNPLASKLYNFAFRGLNYDPSSQGFVVSAYRLNAPQDMAQIGYLDGNLVIQYRVELPGVRLLTLKDVRNGEALAVSIAQTDDPNPEERVIYHKFTFDRQSVALRWSKYLKGGVQNASIGLGTLVFLNDDNLAYLSNKDDLSPGYGGIDYHLGVSDLELEDCPAFSLEFELIRVEGMEGADFTADPTDFELNPVEGSAIEIAMNNSLICDGGPRLECIEDFDDQDLTNWLTIDGSRTIASPGPSGAPTDFYMLASDGPGSSWIYNETDFGESLEGRIGSCLCFDVLIIDDGAATVDTVYPYIDLYQGPPGASTLAARFRSIIPRTENDDWIRLCAPIENCTGTQLPGNAFGQWEMIGSDTTCTGWQSILSGYDGLRFRLDLTSSPTEDYGLDNFCFEECPPPTCEELRLSTTADPSGENECCPVLDFQNNGSASVYGMRVTTLNGIEIDPSSVQYAPGLWAPSFSPNSRLITDQTFAPLSTTVNDLIRFCFSNVTSEPQFVVVDYLDADYATVLCSDTLTYRCPVTNPCLEVVEEITELSCDEGGYRLRMDFFNPPGGTFEDIGYLKVNILAPNPMVDQLDFFFTPTVGAGGTISIDTLLPTTLDLYGDSLCLLISAHDDVDQRLCCFVDSLYVPFPLCEPCPFVEADLLTNPEDSCCFTLVIDNQVPVPDYFDSLVVNVISSPVGGVTAGIPSSGPTWTGTETIPGVQFTYASNGPTSPLLGSPILDFCVAPSLSMDSTYLEVIWIDTTSGIECRDTVAAICKVDDPCPEIEAYLEPVEGEDCCYDVYIANNYTLDPAFFTSIDVTLINGPNPSFAGVSLFPGPAGWNTPTINVPGVSYTFTHPGGIPLTPGTRLMQFCVEPDVSTDSTYVEVGWTALEETVCADTLSAICPECVSITQDSVYCINAGATPPTYVYAFSFTNHSAFDVNTVAILNTDPATPGLLQEELISLGTTVPPGGNYTGTVPVQLSGNPGDTVCFDIVLRQVLPDQAIDIFCCYATHCVVLPECDNELGCPATDLIVTPSTCPEEEGAVVCGCDGNVYLSACFAIQAGVLNYTIGEECGLNRPRVNLNGELTAEGQPDLRWKGEEDTGYRFQSIQMRRPGGNWETVYRLPSGKSLNDHHRHLAAMYPLADTEFRILVAGTDGKATFSNVLTLRPDGEANDLRMHLFPNPATENLLVAANRPGTAKLRVISASGMLVVTDQGDFFQRPRRIDISRQLPGVYTVQLRYADGSTTYARFVKR